MTLDSKNILYFNYYGSCSFVPAAPIPDSTGATINDGENGTLIEADYLKIRRTAFFRSIHTELKQIGGELGLTCTGNGM